MIGQLIRSAMELVLFLYINNVNTQTHVQNTIMIAIHAPVVYNGKHAIEWTNQDFEKDLIFRENKC